MSQATTFRHHNDGDAFDLVEALNASAARNGSNIADIDQDWDNETTIWTFEDGSRIAVSGPEIRLENCRYEAQTIDENMTPSGDLICATDDLDDAKDAIERRPYGGIIYDTRTGMYDIGAGWTNEDLAAHIEKHWPNDDGACHG